MRRVWWMWLAIGLIGALSLAVTPDALWAQDATGPIQVFVMPPVTTSDNGSTLSVRVPFRLLDTEGNSVGNVRITDMKLWLLDMPPGTIDFGNLTQPIEQISAPLYVTLVIDISGSMDDAELADVRNAARTTVERAPANVLFRIVTFHGDYGDPKLQTRQDFTADRNNLRNAIDSITEPGAGTCYYDAIYEELDRLATAGASPNVSTRKAVMAFTDGRDMVNDEKTPCSRHTIDEVIGSARNKAIPIYTLGLAGNLDVGVLTRLADETQGIAVIGAQSELSTLFSQAFAGIVNQYEAEFAALPDAGRNRAYVEVSLANTNEAARSALFEFDSPRSYIPTPTPVPPTETPLPPPTATLMPATYVDLEPGFYDAAQDEYVFPISLTNPQIVGALELRVIAGSQTIHKECCIEIDGKDLPNHEFRVKKSVFQQGREYDLEVRGSTIYGDALLRPQDQLNRQPDLVLAKLEDFQLPEEEIAPMEASIVRVVDPPYGSAEFGAMSIELAIKNQAVDITKWRAVIFDETNTIAGGTDEEVFSTLTLKVPRPASVIEQIDNPQPRDFKVIVYLWPENSDEPLETTPWELKGLIAPAKPGFFAIIWSGINQNPLIAIAIVVVISSIALYFVFGRKPARPAYSLARSAEEYTVVAGAASGGGGGKHHGKLAVDVFETPSPGERKKQSFNRFPCVIGRSSQCDVRLAGDSQLSRRHAQLVLENGRILLTDLGSNNGTFVDEQRINANTATPLSDGQVIRLGRQTRIRVSMSY